VEAHVSEQIAVTVEDHSEEVYNPENTQVSIEEEEAPVPEVLDEIPVASEMVAVIASQIEDVPKKSYAYIVSIHSKNTSCLFVHFQLVLIF